MKVVLDEYKIKHHTPLIDPKLMVQSRQQDSKDYHWEDN